MLAPAMPHNTFDTLDSFDLGNGKRGQFYSLPKLEQAGIGRISRLPVSIRVVLESVLRNIDGKKITENDVRTLANWACGGERTDEIPFMVARVLLQDFTGVPLLVDLAAMRTAAKRAGKDPRIIEPLVPVDLVVDHSVQVDYSNRPDALQLNMDIEFKRNQQRYQFLKWGTQAFNGFQVIPPGIGIVHQVNLEYLARGILQKDGVYYPDTLVGTDSHTTMINGLGIVGWGVGGIEAEAGMLGQPVYFLTPDVVGVHLTGALNEGVTATDLALTVTQVLRKTKVVGKFVEFFGAGAAALPVVDRATIANMAPEYGATMGFFPIDHECVNYLRATGRTDTDCQTYENYYKAQGLWGIPQPGQIQYSQVVELDISTVKPSVAGPKRPQDRIELPKLGHEFVAAFSKPIAENGFGKPAGDFHKTIHVEGEGWTRSVTSGGSHKTDDLKPVASSTPANSVGSDNSAKDTSVSTEREMANNRPATAPTPIKAKRIDGEVGHGSVLIAAITSCTNTSNPSVMLAAGLLAKKAVERGLRVNSVVKSSLAPGSRVVTDYLEKTGLQKYLDQLGFQTVGYGCTTCIGNSGPLHPAIEEAITKNDLVAASVLSGNRNFEARVHQNIKANFLMSPPLVVAFALAGRVDVDLTKDPLGQSVDGTKIYLRDVWPSLQEVRDAMQSALTPEVFRNLYRDFAEQNPKWNEIPSSRGDVYLWDERSDYIHEPPFFKDFSMEPGRIEDIRGARPLGIFGDSVTTDHISPAGAIKPTSPAGQYLVSRGVKPEDFNSYGSRRGNDLVMTRGTFANVRIKNLMVPGVEGGVTIHYPDGEQMSIFDASMKYREDNVPLVILAGHEYGTGSSRDWAAKGTRLLGVKAVIAASFERIHRSNLVGMGVLPLQFLEGTNSQSLRLDGSETYSVTGLSSNL